MKTKKEIEQALKENREYLKNIEESNLPKKEKDRECLIFREYILALNWVLE